MPAIEVNDEYLEMMATVLRGMSELVVASPHGTLNGFKLKAGGPNFTMGADVTSRFTTAAAGVQSTLTTFGTTMSTRSAQIRMFRAITDDTEALNQQSSEFFNQHFPGWTGQTTPPPSTNTPSTNTPPTNTPPTNPPSTNPPPATTP